MRYCVVIIYVPMDTPTRIRKNPIAKCSIADPWTPKRVQRHIRIKKPAECQHCKRRAKTMAGEADLHARIYAPVTSNQPVNVLHSLIQGNLEAPVNEARSGEQVRNEGEVSKR